MNTPTNAYLSRTFSISVLLMLAFSGTLFVLPLTAPAHAANASLPSISFTDNVLSGGHSSGITLSNPSSNTYEITGLTITAPSGWTWTGSGANANIGCNAISSTSITCTAALPPGATITTPAWITITPQAPSTVNAVVGTFTTTVQDQSSSAFYAGPSTKVYSIGTAGYAFAINAFASGDNCNGNTFVAGSGTCAASATLSDTGSIGIAGVPVTWTVTSAAGSVSPSTGFTDSTGKVTTTLTPSNTAGAAATVFHAGLGTSALTTTAVTVATTAASPVSATFYISAVAFPGSATHYIGGANNAAPPNGGTGPHDATIASGLTLSATDRFGNPIDVGTGGPLTGLAITVSATAAGGVFTRAGANYTTITLAAGDITVAASPSYAATIADPYFQLGTYRSTDVLTATISATTPSFTVSGSSGALVTSTFDTSSVAPIEDSHDCTSCAAGTTISLHSTPATVQRGVPVIFFLDTATSTLANGDGTMSVSTTTGANGTAGALFKLDTGVTTPLYFLAQFGDASQASGHLANSTDSAPLVATVAGAASALVLETYYDSAATQPTSYGVNGTTLYVNVALADKYGNPTLNTFPYQIQITLSGPGGFSATSVYIQSGQPDTVHSFGSILWTAPNTFATETLSAASTFPTATDKVTLVSATPTFSVTSPKPLSGVIYSSSTAVTFQGQANVSLGYASSVHITSVGYSVDGGHWQSATVAAGNKITWAVSVFVTAGLHSVQFNATDNSAASNTVVSQKYSVLVDSSAPDVNFVTAANANITSPATVTANVIDKMGDLNTTSVSAVATNIQTAATKTLTVAVTPNTSPGNSVTYPVTITGLTTGNWSIALSATDYAGNSNSSTITVHVTVPAGESFVVSGTPSKGTLGTFTGINVNYQNLNPSSESVVVFAVFQSSQGTVGVFTSSGTVSAGATQSFFIAETGMAPGSYTVNLFVLTTSGQPVSITTPITVTV